MVVTDGADAIAHPMSRQLRYHVGALVDNIHCTVAQVAWGWPCFYGGGSSIPYFGHVIMHNGPSETYALCIMHYGAHFPASHRGSNENPMQYQSYALRYNA